MSEHALYVVIRRGVWGGRGRGGGFPPLPMVFAFLVFFLGGLVSSVTYGYDDNIPTHSRRHGGREGGGGGQVPPMIFVFVSFWLLAQRSVMAMIVPLPHY